MGALLPCASCTDLIICASTVSLPTFLDSILNTPCLFKVEPITLLPFSLSTGILSPVNILSSTLDSPSITIPSTGIFSPGRTITISPITTSFNGTSISTLFLTTFAVLGFKPINFLMAEPVFPLARTSINFPNLIKVIITAEVSK